MSFDKTHGFQQAGVYDPEYVKLQRKDIVKKFQDECEKLRAEIKKLEDRKKGIATEIAERFKTELIEIQGIQAAMKLKDKQDGEARSVLKRQIKEFEALKDKDAEIFKQTLAKIDAENKRATALIASSNKLEAKLITLQKTVKSDESRLLEAAKTLEKEKKDLDKIASDLKYRETTVQEAENRIKTRSKAISNDRATLDTKQSEIKDALKEITEENEILTLKELAVKTSMDDLKTRLDALEAAEAAVKETAKALKLDRADLNSRETQLHIAKQNFRQFSAIKKRELDDREAEIKALEKKVGE